ncbi:MAG TPA: hypothetical protein DDW55_02990 [Gammaproteobacteria bacterium]|nr:hypothetical protein [Gammaproteobacteria bacterium]
MFSGSLAGFRGNNIYLFQAEPVPDCLDLFYALQVSSGGRSVKKSINKYWKIYTFNPNIQLEKSLHIDSKGNKTLA